MVKTRSTLNSTALRRNKLSTAVAMGVLMVSGDSIAESRVIEEVVITATRRAQSVQDVPINISVVTGDTIRETGVSDLNDLIRLVPGLVTTDLGADAGVNNSLISFITRSNNCI